MADGNANPPEGVTAAQRAREVVTAIARAKKAAKNLRMKPSIEATKKAEAKKKDDKKKNLKKNQKKNSLHFEGTYVANVKNL